MHTPFVAELPNLTWQHVEEGHVSWESATLPIPQERSSRALQFWGSPVFMPTTQNDQIRLGNTYGEPCFWRSATPLRLQKWVARFVSDSWASYFCLYRAVGWARGRASGLEKKWMLMCCCSGRLSWFSVSIWAHVKIALSYRVVLYIW